MKKIRELLKDRRRSQRGSVLSGVLIMMAFIAIISGALMTALSTNFLLSQTLMSRMTNQATVNSATELSLNQLQGSPLNSPCPSPPAVQLNNVWAVPSYETCWPTVRENPQFTRLQGSTAPFNVDGTHAVINGLDDYLVGDAAGNVYDYRFGSTMPRWTLALGGSITAPPLALADPNRAGSFLDAIPLSGPSCSPATNCLGVWSDNNSSNRPSEFCEIPTASGRAILSQPFSSPSKPGLIYYGDGTYLESTDVSQLSGGACDSESNSAVSGSQPVAAGPIAFRCTKGCNQGADYIYVLVSDQSSSRLVRYNGDYNISFAGSLSLPWGDAAGMAVSATALPANVAIALTDGGGIVAMVHIAQNGTMSLTSSTAVPGALMDAPYWCVCPGGDVIGVGAQNGSLYLFDSSLALLTSYAGGSPISTTPGADGAGNWYYGAGDGRLHEIQVQAGQAVQVNSYGTMGPAGSAVQVGACSTGICVYMGGMDNYAYLVPLDARHVVVKACVTGSATSPCSGANPRLRAEVEVGALGNRNMVHVQGWSYYSG